MCTHWLVGKGSMQEGAQPPSNDLLLLCPPEVCIDDIGSTEDSLTGSDQVNEGFVQDNEEWFWPRVEKLHRREKKNIWSELCC